MPEASKAPKTPDAPAVVPPVAPPAPPVPPAQSASSSNITQPQAPVPNPGVIGQDPSTAPATAPPTGAAPATGAAPPAAAAPPATGGPAAGAAPTIPSDAAGPEVPQIQIQGMTGFVIYEWPEGTWLNHLVIRPNGQLVMTMYDRPEIHVFEPLEPDAAPLLAHRFANNTRINAIAEYIPDYYAVLGTIYNSTDSSYTSQLWKLRLDSIAGPRLDWLAEVPDADNIVSLTALNYTHLLAANREGAINTINVNTGANIPALSDPTMIPGISTVKYRAPYVYYTNTVQGTFARVPIDPQTMEALAPAEVIVDRATGIMDVALAPFAEQEGYLVNYEQNTVLRVNSIAKVDTVMTGLKAPTAASFGRTQTDQKTLYVVSGAPLGIGQGKIVSINVEK